MRSPLKPIILILAAGAVAAAAASADRTTVNFKIAGHQFEVPKDRLFEMTIPWLPQPESDSFTFLLEPRPNTDKIPEHRVLVQRLSRLCPTDSNSEETRMLRIVCGQEKTDVPDEPPFLKLPSNLGSWASDLYAVAAKPSLIGDTAKRPIAYCQLFQPNAFNPKPSTVCTTFWAYKDLVLQFSFDETQSSEMPAMKAKAQNLLDGWEVR